MKPDEAMHHMAVRHKAGHRVGYRVLRVKVFERM